MIPDDMITGDTFLFYNGEVVLRFDHDKHLYLRAREDGVWEIQDGVTTVCNIIDHSVYLMPWAVKMMYLKLLRTVPRCSTDKGGSVVGPVNWEDFDKLLVEAKKAHKEHFEDAGDVGDAAHKWIEASIRNAMAFTNGVVEKMNEYAPTDERAVNCGVAAHDWMTRHNVRWIRTERKVYSRAYRYAGTMDGLALVDSCDDPSCCGRMYHDELALIDWKSSNHLRAEYLYQTAAYQQAEQEEFGSDIKARWILRLGKEDGKFEAWYETNFDQDFDAFLACLFLYRAHKGIEKRMAEDKKLKTFARREQKKQSKPKAFKKRKVKDAGNP